MTKSRDFIGPYRLARLIRVGSTAEVWEAIEEHDQGRVALKMLKQSLSTNKSEIALLKHEFNVAKDLKIPVSLMSWSIVRIRDVPAWSWSCSAK